MNSNQQSNIVSSIVQMLMGILVTHGYLTGSDVQTIGGAIGALVMWAISHNWHSTPPASGSAPLVSSSAAGKVASAVLLFSVLSGALVFSGCSTANTAAYQATATASVTVETALHAYDVFAAQGKTTVAQNQAVAAAYAKYQAAFAVLCDAGAAYAASSVTNAAGVSGSQAALQEAQANAAQSLTDLENLITSFGVSL